MNKLNFFQYQQEDRRLCFLIALDQTAGYGANHFLLRECLAAAGHTASHDQVITDGKWLAEQGLVTESKAGDSHIFTLTTRGVDCANGRIVTHGVKRPMP